jgi:hypothetical protein
VDALFKYVYRSYNIGNLSEDMVKLAQALDAICRTMNPGHQNNRFEYFKDLDGVKYKKAEEWRKNNSRSPETNKRNYFA